ncbi:MAG: ABC transporter permease [Desulfurococcaceae archaeon]
MVSIKIGEIPFYVLLALALFILVAPIGIPLSVAFSENTVISFPPTGFSLRWFHNIFSFRSLTDGFVHSLKLASIASLTALLVTLPASYVLYRYSFKGRKLVENLFLMPTTIPEIVLSYMLLIYLVKLLGVGSFSALLVGHVLILIPHAMRYVYVSLANVGHEIEDAAVSLGAPRLKAFLDIVVPNIRTGMVAGIVMSFITSFNAFSISLFLSYGETMPLPIAMWNYLQVRYDPTIAAVSFVLVLFSLSFVLIVRKIIGIKVLKL